jgi:hypothetical protein
MPTSAATSTEGDDRYDAADGPGMSLLRASRPV